MYCELFQLTEPPFRLTPDPQFLFDQLRQIGFNDALSTLGVSAPACVKQGPQQSIGQISESTDYTHVYSFAP